MTSVTFAVYGARGGGVDEFIGGVLNVISSGGPGGEAKAKFKVHAGEVFEILVGGQGGAATVGSNSGFNGGFNGGGNGDPEGGNARSGGGGGASDVRIGGRRNGCASGMSCGYQDRIVVGGGGGGGSFPSGQDGDGGGGLTGTANGTGRSTCVNAAGEGAAQECAGIGYARCPPGYTGDGTFGVGGDSCPYSESGGGGGGWFGGGSGGGVGVGGVGFGGGGSGYISPLSLSGSFPGGTSVGNGEVIVTT